MCLFIDCHRIIFKSHLHRKWHKKLNLMFSPATLSPKKLVRVPTGTSGRSQIANQGRLSP